jgi:hypothetical protein
MTTQTQNAHTQFTITKKIAKHGKQSIIIIPANLKEKINAGMLVKVTIDVLESGLVVGEFGRVGEGAR